ncbi:uncharacterized protein SPSK_02521 [Sporothrix schenckii 1099-18]|uniref:BTB domain-containing protein n=2 Tax=Sporothrix schenckii TaxID=29908 RepID=U7PIZ8_SPOS1|nr:uncharacterized protein SPSK_02521 [Sporothrix schenckii 1099-18]ERS95507.1 hypothetical protein HMPREF1624_08023 [Sporothrix schenckii ATCC 58251]KJR86797.1 hypothetical protein SPSK_02521 [Sporothrix schenckii 1099-18]
MYSDLLRVLVGQDHREFVVHRGLLCASSPFFRDSIDAVPEGLTPSSPASTPPSSPPSPPPTTKPTLIWLSGESANVFELFVLWLYRRHAFRAVVEDAVTILAREARPDEVITLFPEHDSDTTDTSTDISADALVDTSASANLSDLHWHLVRLHLFAAYIDIPVLQDAVMDALQDLYLRFDWTATPALLTFLYVEADPRAACRLRKWSVALLAWTLANSNSSGDDHAEPARHGGLAEHAEHAEHTQLRALLRLMEPLADEYAAHISKMKASRADTRIKNPQLRIPSNQLRREDRHFGFRQCSFHSHRRAAGEGRCPHERARRRGALDVVSSLALPLHLGKDVRMDVKDANKTVSEAVHKNVTEPVHNVNKNASHVPPRRPSQHSPSASLCSLSSLSSTSSGSEPRREDLPVWSPLSVTTPGYAPLGMESTI